MPFQANPRVHPLRALAIWPRAYFQIWVTIARPGHRVNRLSPRLLYYSGEPGFVGPAPDSLKQTWPPDLVNHAFVRPIELHFGLGKVAFPTFP